MSRAEPVENVHDDRARRRSFTPEFKAQTVELLRTSGKSVAEVCRDLDLTETAVRRWVAQAEIDAGRRDGLTTAEREELSQLRRENRVLRGKNAKSCKSDGLFRLYVYDGLALWVGSLFRCPGLTCGFSLKRRPQGTLDRTA